MAYDNDVYILWVNDNWVLFIKEELLEKISITNKIEVWCEVLNELWGWSTQWMDQPIMEGYRYKYWQEGWSLNSVDIEDKIAEALGNTEDTDGL